VFSFNDIFHNQIFALHGMILEHWSAKVFRRTDFYREAFKLIGIAESI